MLVLLIGAMAALVIGLRILLFGELFRMTDFFGFR
jgi:hypothetical protein